MENWSFGVGHFSYTWSLQFRSLLFRSQREIEGGAAPLNRFGPGISALLANAAHDGGKADTRSGIFARRVQALERGKQLARILHAEADPIVPDKERRASDGFGFADFDKRLD